MSEALRLQNSSKPSLLFLRRGWSARIVRSPLSLSMLFVAALMMAVAPLALNHAVGVGGHVHHQALDTTPTDSTSHSVAHSNGCNHQPLAAHTESSDDPTTPPRHHDEDSCAICHLISQIRHATIPSIDDGALLFVSSAEHRAISFEVTAIDPSEPHLPSSAPRAPPV